MAKIETIGLIPGDAANLDFQAKIINVSAPVGHNAVNQKHDVLAVQALMSFGLEGKRDFPTVDLPIPCGWFIDYTAGLIKRFQKWHNRQQRQTPISIDGLVNPAQGGIYTPGKRKFWTIYALNLYANEKAMMLGASDHVEAMCKKWPFLRVVLNPKGVGTLALDLE